MVVKKVTWQHELMYIPMGQYAMYQDLSVTLFMAGYFAVMETIKTTLKVVMIKNLKELK